MWRYHTSGHSLALLSWSWELGGVLLLRRKGEDRSAGAELLESGEGGRPRVTEAARKEAGHLEAAAEAKACARRRRPGPRPQEE